MILNKQNCFGRHGSRAPPHHRTGKLSVLRSMLTPRRSAILDALRGGGAVVLLVEAFADDRLPNRLAAGNGAGGHDQPLG